MALTLCSRLCLCLYLCLTAILLAGCSLFERTSAAPALSSESPHSNPSNEMVPRQEYEALLKRYQALEQKLAGPPPSVETSTQASLETTVSVSSDVEPPTLQATTPPMASSPTEEVASSEATIEGEIASYQQAKKWQVGQQDAKALELLDQLEKSATRQIRVQAKYLKGEILFEQKAYDLAMVAFEEIVNNMDYSGRVIHALEKLILCSDKLGLVEKRERYQALYNHILNS